MAHIPKNRRLQRTFLVTLAGSMLIAMLTLLPLAVAPPLSPITALLSAFAAYDPATYGIPYQIGGFKVLAIKTSENTACVSSGMMTVKIQSSQPDVQSAMANSGDTRIVYETLQQIPSLNNIKFVLEVSGTVPWNPQRFMSEIAKWNEATKNGCFQFGGPIADVAPDRSVAYDPATFGIPEIVAGYRIVAVNTPENTACVPDGEIRVTIQAVEPSADNPMVAADGGDIVFELKKIYPDVQWSLTYIMPGSFAREQAVAAIQQWNGAMENGCINIGGPIVLATPDAFAPYDPATFSLPEIIAGYRIVAVHAANNTPCMALNAVRLVIQAVDPSPDNPMVAREGGDIIFEVSQLHPDIDWQLQYIMPGSFDREQFVASMQTWNKNGCTKLGGPEYTPTPVP